MDGKSPTLNTGDLRNEIIDLIVIIEKKNLNYFVIRETILDESFPSTQFKLNEYKERATRHRYKDEGGPFFNL